MGLSGARWGLAVLSGAKRGLAGLSREKKGRERGREKKKRVHAFSGWLAGVGRCR